MIGMVEQRRASFFEISGERVEAEDEMPNAKVQMSKGKESREKGQVEVKAKMEGGIGAA